MRSFLENMFNYCCIYNKDFAERRNYVMGIRNDINLFPIIENFVFFIFFFTNCYFQHIFQDIMRRQQGRKVLPIHLLHEKLSITN